MFAPLRSDSITILAMHTNTLNAFSPPVGNDNEVWCIGHHKYARNFATRAFEAHAQSYVERRATETTYLRHWIEELQEFASERPVYTLHPWQMSLGPYHYNWCPQVGHLNENGKPFVESSIGYMLMAVYWAHKRVGPLRELRMYGISLESNVEYGYQKPNALYWIGRLAEAGVSIVYPKGCNVFGSAWPTGEYGLLENLGPPKTKR